MNLKQQATSGFLWNAIDRFSAQIIQLVVTILLGRLLLPEIFGLIGMLSIFISISQTFVDGVYSSLDQIQKLEGGLYQLKIIQRHFKMPRLTYIRRRINSLGHYNVAINKNPQAFIYKSLITIHRTLKKLQPC